MGSADRPSILLVVIDSGRADRFGCYGYRRGTTPAIDDLARQSWVYERMIASAPWTLPSHASLFTGLYAREHGADYPTLTARSGLLTLDRHLRDYGYTSIFLSNNPLVGRRSGIIDPESRVMMRQDFNPEARRPWRRRLRKLVGESDRGAAATNRAAGRLLATQRGPLFVFINYMECHWRYVAPAAFERRFVRRPWSRVHSAIYRTRTSRRYSWENARVKSAEEGELLSDLYDAALACVDDRIGDLLERLARSGREQDTIVIVTADHGENLGDHGLTGHGMSLHQTLLLVPFMIRVPGRAAAPRTALSQLTDLFGGLCGLAGIPLPAALSARPFSADPFSVNGVGREYAFAEYAQPQAGIVAKRLARTGFLSPPSAEAVRDNRYSLVLEMASGTERLFDLQEDPQESHDRSAALPEQRRRLRSALDEWRSTFQPAGEQRDFTPEEEQAIEARLRDLGYV